jgi:2-hydroxy-3-oxopropionate reductase
MANIGFVGLGIMGRPMALNLIKGGHVLFLHSRSGVPAELTAAGGKACANAAEVTRAADIVITMLPDTPDVEKVLFGEDGVAAGLSTGQLVVDMSSISPIETKCFARLRDQLERWEAMCLRLYPGYKWTGPSPKLLSMSGVWARLLKAGRKCV